MNPETLLGVAKEGIGLVVALMALGGMLWNRNRSARGLTVANHEFEEIRAQMAELEGRIFHEIEALRMLVIAREERVKEIEARTAQLSEFRAMLHDVRRAKDRFAAGASIDEIQRDCAPLAERAKNPVFPGQPTSFGAHVGSTGETVVGLGSVALLMGILWAPGFLHLLGRNERRAAFQRQLEELERVLAERVSHLEGILAQLQRS